MINNGLVGSPLLNTVSELPNSSKTLTSAEVFQVFGEILWKLFSVFDSTQLPVADALKVFLGQTHYRKG